MWSRCCFHGNTFILLIATSTWTTIQRILLLHLHRTNGYEYAPQCYLVRKLPLLFTIIKQNHDNSRVLYMSDIINPRNRNVGFVSSTSDSLFNNKKTCFSDRVSHFLKFHCNDMKAYRLTASPNSLNIGVSQFCLLFCFHTIVLQESVHSNIASREVPVLLYNHNTHTPFVLA